MTTTTNIEKTIIGNPKIATLPQLESYSREYLAALESGYRPSTATLTKMFDSLDNVTSGKPSLMAALTAVETEIVEQVFLRDPRLATNAQLAPMLSFYAGLIAHGYEPDAATATAIVHALEGVTTSNPTLLGLLDTITHSLAGSPPVAVASTILLLDGTAHGTIEGKLAGHDPDGSAVSFALDPNGSPAHGSLVIRADGTYSYTPVVGYAGSDTFAFTVTDADGRSSTATVSVKVAAAVPSYSAVQFDGTAGHDVLHGGSNSLYEFYTFYDPDFGQGTALRYTQEQRLYLMGHEGDDIITGRAYNFENYLFGDEGHDVITGGANSGTNFLVGGLGNDTLTGGVGSSRNELHGGDGNDTLIGGEAGTIIAVDHRSPNYLYGEAGDDILVGGSYFNLLDGGTGNDRVTGGSGQDDVVLGDAGGGDFADGGDSQSFIRDTLTLIGGAGGETMRAVGHDAFVDGRLIGQNFETFTFAGGAGNDTLIGGEGFDGPYAIYPQNYLFGGAGKDALVGGAARDWLVGGTDDDLLTGGAGRDYFAFNPSENTGTDTITDFEIGADIITFREGPTSGYGEGYFAISEAHVGGDAGLLDTVLTLTDRYGNSMGRAVLLDVSGLNESILIWGTWTPPLE
ncbi:Hemolysin-type calcium-binding protein region [Rubellimicrobium mesophilum DSM 19309]|uniref:Hemolysin-type calcium-binding protein region n=1 Tax=Rubellimicrobium mesophilum DSM 19309 TaxID=442562 RepID=A0A017HLL5_9RHOB|nr:Ig-like domain-containing protein [Rubellimicrobium mesophilum]EYD75397.1 Hemolysin-type calcium-binding protein region [Rubellimicrobium mesophilum DSM 19309]